MSQINTLKVIRFVLIQILFFSMLSACSKAPSGVSAHAKTQQNNLTPAASSQANQVAASLNANYNIATISLPKKNSSDISINSELTSPSGEVLPLTTVHSSAGLDSYGIYNDTQRGLQVRVDARCSNSSDCNKYILLVTVMKSNQMVYQTFAISYKDDCTFSVASTSVDSGKFFRELNAAENAYSISPVYDIDTCPNQ